MYKLIRDSDTVLDLSFVGGLRFVPKESSEYTEWIARGNIPEPEDQPTQEQILQGFIAIKNQVVDAKLKAMRYDSLATVKLWADDATYGAEATAILNWYKAITVMSIQLENDVVAGTVPMPTEEEYKAMIEGVVL